MPRPGRAQPRVPQLPADARPAGSGENAGRGAAAVEGFGRGIVFSCCSFGCFSLLLFFFGGEGCFSAFECLLTKKGGHFSPSS